MPEDFKTARITPLYKKKSKLEVGNYRPVSVLNCVIKILAKSVYVQIGDYLFRKQLYSLQPVGYNYITTVLSIVGIWAAQKLKTVVFFPGLFQIVSPSQFEPIPSGLAMTWSFI